MVARVNVAILRHIKLKFGKQILLDLKKESFWLPGGFGYHGNTKVSLNVQTVFVDHS